MFGGRTRYGEHRRWLGTLFGAGRGAQVIRNELPRPFAAYGRLFPPLELNHPDGPTVHRGSELAVLCGMEFSAMTTWPELERAIGAARNHGLRDIGMDRIVNTAWDLSPAWRSVIGKALSRHDDSTDLFYGVWNGHGWRFVPRSGLYHRRHFDLSFRGYYVWTGEYEDFGTFSARDRSGYGVPQDVAWPESRAWCYLVDTDWSSVLIGASRAALDELVQAAEVELLEIDGTASSMVLSEL